MPAKAGIFTATVMPAKAGISPPATVKPSIRSPRPIFGDDCLILKKVDS